MATRRKKSAMDIQNQYERIARLNEYISERDGHRAVDKAQEGMFDPISAKQYTDAYAEAAQRSYDRLDKAHQIASKYISNIKQSKSYNNLRKSTRGKDADTRHNKFVKAINRKYSANTYQGLNKG